MEIERVLKQLDWLDEQRRRDRGAIDSLEERIADLEELITPLSSQIKSLESQINRLASQLTRIDQFDDNLLQQRVDAKQYFDELERLIQKQQEENEKVRMVEMRAIDASVAELRKELEALPELRRSINARIEEENRLTRLIDEVRGRIDTIRRSEEETNRTFRLIEDGRRQDSKRLIDLQGEVVTIRKTIDEHHGRIELSAIEVDKVEARLAEVERIETERRKAQEKFIESLNLREVERNRIWKDWEARFDTIEGQAADIDTYLQSLDTTQRNVQKTQQNVEEVTQKVERRINEITEIQRLSEERFRQEWVSFKADDQKRWTNYTLTLDEQRGEYLRQMQKLVDRITQLEDAEQQVTDLITQMNEQTEKRLQALRAIAMEWVSNYERFIGHQLQ